MIQFVMGVSTVLSILAIVLTVLSFMGEPTVHKDTVLLIGKPVWACQLMSMVAYYVLKFNN